MLTLSSIIIPFFWLMESNYQRLTVAHWFRFMFPLIQSHRLSGVLPRWLVCLLIGQPGDWQGYIVGENAFPKRCICGVPYVQTKQFEETLQCWQFISNCSHPLPELDHYVAREACSVLVAAGVQSLASLMLCSLPVSSSRLRSNLVPERTNAHCQEHGGVNAFNGTCSRECWFAFAKIWVSHTRGNYLIDVRSLSWWT